MKNNIPTVKLIDFFLHNYFCLHFYPIIISLHKLQLGIMQIEFKLSHLVIIICD